MQTSAEKIAELYDRFLEEGYDSLAKNRDHHKLLPVIEDFIKDFQIDQDQSSILDLGCGPGTIKEYTHFQYYAGVDLSDAMLQAAANRGYNELIQSSLEEYLPLLPDNSFDVVFCFSVSYFIEPEHMATILTHIDRIARSHWLITFDGIPENLIRYYAEYNQVGLYNHIGMAVPEGAERYTIAGWKNAVSLDPVPVEIIRRRK